MKTKCALRKGGNFCKITKTICTKDSCAEYSRREERRKKSKEYDDAAERMLSCGKETE